MSRAIKFRGRCSEETIIDTKFCVKQGQWAYGWLVDGYILQDKQPIPIDPGTVGQFTGLHDKNGKEIYEGDLLKTVRGDSLQTEPELVEWGDYGFYPWEFGAGDGYMEVREVEVIGNIYESPELLTTQEK